MNAVTVITLYERDGICKRTIKRLQMHFKMPFIPPPPRTVSACNVLFSFHFSGRWLLRCKV